MHVLIRGVLVLFFGWITLSPAQAKLADDCACPEITCNPCEREVDIKFYSEKCAGGKKVKSCKRPICQPLEPAPAQCLAVNSQKEKTYEQVEKKEKLELRKVEVSPQKKSLKRAHVGIVVVAQGRSWVTQTHKEKPQRAKVGLKIFEKDLVETTKNGKVKILFKDKNTLNITPNSKMRIAEIKMEGGRDDRTMLDLMYGKIRSKVNKKYDGASNNYYRVRTRAAVAGVRGTDFVVSYREDDGVESKVETVSGVVALVPRQSHDDDGDLLEIEESAKRVEIPKGAYAKFVIDKENIATDVFTDSDIANFVTRGYMTPVYKLTAKELKVLENETDFSNSRMVASEEEPVAGNFVCETPQAPYNYCAWTCRNNPKKQKRCRTDLPNVQCVRKRCNANGKWAEETRLPASFHDYCEADGVKVRPCDY